MNGVKCPHCGAYTVNEPAIIRHPGGFDSEYAPVAGWYVHSSM